MNLPRKDDDGIPYYPLRGGDKAYASCGSRQKHLDMLYGPRTIGDLGLVNGKKVRLKNRSFCDVVLSLIQPVAEAIFDRLMANRPKTNCLTPQSHVQQSNVKVLTK